MAKQTKQERRKTYSLEPERSKELARKTLDITDAVGKTVHRQQVLDVLVGLLKDKDVYAKVCATVAKA